ncbi:MAG: iron-containing alcohol dehydrogenase [Candidatus Diapherotrites archaeon]|uniref:Iron-containing alcohol dehydrogenase n=1 Tax=Candidatus Iainarchaeum sp. TaxID=3101447 RepID=A0A8T3YIP9_9ARCH|nr:iron-containing alcohol dehydrogenase [Candidatus Diapherotrites archaeon]
MKKYFLPVKIIFGEKSYQKLFSELEGAGVKKPLLICGSHFVSSFKYKDFEEKVPVFEVFTGVEPNPSTSTVDRAASLLNSSQCDAVVGIGGGSVLDAAKVVACMHGFKKSCESFYRKPPHRKNRVPFFAVPTTSGSGSEATRYSVLTRSDGSKKTLRHDLFYARVAIVDPELTYSMPPEVTAATGIDAFCQSVEAYWAKTATPQTDAFAAEAIGLAYHSIFKAVNDPDKQARQNMSLASLCAAQAFSNTGTTACHQVSYPLTRHFGLVHGFAVAITLQWFLGFYSEKGGKAGEKCLEICRLIGAKTIAEGREKLIGLLSSIGAPTKLREIGCRPEDFQKIVAVCLEERPQNPRKHTKEDIERMLAEIC